MSIVTSIEISFDKTIPKAKIKATISSLTFQLHVVHEEEGDHGKINEDRATSPSYNELNNDAVLTRSTTANTRSSILLFDNNKDNTSNDRKVNNL